MWPFRRPADRLGDHELRSLQVGRPQFLLGVLADPTALPSERGQPVDLHVDVVGHRGYGFLAIVEAAAQLPVISTAPSFAALNDADTNTVPKKYRVAVFTVGYR
jgi:hypothetical protein